jgi:hypothetical protein
MCPDVVFAKTILNLCPASGQVVSKKNLAQRAKSVFWGEKKNEFIAK